MLLRRVKLLQYPIDIYDFHRLSLAEAGGCPCFSLFQEKIVRRLRRDRATDRPSPYSELLLG